jgi:hypothetical protein
MGRMQGKKKVPCDQTNILREGEAICIFTVLIFRTDHRVWDKLESSPNIHQGKKFIKQQINCGERRMSG